MSEKDEVIKVNICPKCKSFDVAYEFKIKNLFGIIPRIRCKKCNYSSHAFPVFTTTKSEIEKRNKKLGKKKKWKKKEKKK